MVGGFSTAYDLVQSEYGWTDEQIGELPLVRLRQITAAIQRRKFLVNREENSRFSWMARNIAQFIAAGYMIGEGQENTALTQAGLLALDDIERAVLNEAVENTPAKENEAGSFERLMRFGGGMQAQGQ